MKKLYISDLDGTLLNEKGEITQTTADILNQHIAKGGLFTIATARMPYTCDTRLAKIELQMPAILMNGVMLYDFKNKKYLSHTPIAPHVYRDILAAVTKHQCQCYVYTYKNEGLHLYFEDDALDVENQYYHERAQKGCLFAGQITSFEQILNEDIVYIAALGEKEQMLKLQAEIETMEGVGSSGYINIYNGGYCLEIFSCAANKATRAKELKQTYGADTLISFGDNYNDVKVMKASDECYAPQNALDEIKAFATGILPSHNEDGVARFIAQQEGINLT